MQEEELNLQTIQKRAISAFLSLTFRRIALQAITFISINLILARIYPPETGILGIFNLGAAIIAFASYFSDIGLAASLIQKKEKVTHDDLKTTFTIQEVLIATLTIVVFVAAPSIASFYKLDTSGIWLIRALAFSFLITSFKVIPSVTLERHLNFKPLVVVEIFETLIFNIFLLTLAFSGFGLWAFSAASVIRAFVGTSTLFAISPWKVGFGISKEAIRGLLSFGIPYQTNALLALLKDRLVPIFVAKVVGTTGLSFVTWAQALAFLPLEVMTIVIRITFPAYARLQDNHDELRGAIEKSLFATTLFLYPALFGLLALAPQVVSEVVSDKWRPALPSLYLFSFATFWASISTTFTNALSAIGQIKTTLKLMVFWTILTWILTPIFVFWIGFNGVALASAIISFTSFLSIWALKKHVPVSVLSSIRYPLLASLIMGTVVYFLAQAFVFNLVSLLITIILGGLFYFILIYILDRKETLRELKGILNEVS